MAYPWLREIHVSARQSPKELFDTYIHETIHVVCPHMAEKKVGHLANEICEVLWRVGYRQRKKR
jgi:hypothetical protein